MYCAEPLSWRGALLPGSISSGVAPQHPAIASVAQVGSMQAFQCANKYSAWLAKGRMHAMLRQCAFAGSTG